ncbi:acyl-CoA dehydrogenase family protein [Falsiroseomonas stagni]|uniref:Pimeloyl-CoA dehydrogenase, small subunit n=1 Tax=Falsiroseomonas stagni DSM 19981 TaxID=1123062 RepID=A0A1I3Z3Q1_9PROT|nr:acyl-CoA dehydrogenase family protein [Falsiroseomonas stagni]SFK38714.1 pimeloyl-CoA dehydrogenase, small subunit [Falsiroseomonas stagni DSM 19981]
MDFDLTDEQRMLSESVNRLLTHAYGDFEHRKGYRAAPRGFADANWQALAEMGLLGLPFDEADGGFGGGPVETMIVMEAFGRGLVLEPFLATVVLAGGLLRRAGSEAQREAILPSVVEGSMVLAFAHQERQARHDLHDVATAARRDGADWVLDGAKGVVLAGDSADRIIVSARTSGARRDREGISLFLLDPATPGVTRRGYATQDGLRAAELVLEGARVPADALLGHEGQALPLIELVVDEANAALCAEALGAMDVLRDLTVDYLKQRQQFGQAIGNFQALQHRAADMLVATEQARSMAMYAAMMVQSGDAAARRTALSAAKALVAKLADQLGKDAIQLHGGIAMTEEYKAGHYFKRLTMIGTLFGDVDHHLRVVVAAGGLPEAV